MLTINTIIAYIYQNLIILTILLTALLQNLTLPLIYKVI